MKNTNTKSFFAGIALSALLFLSFSFSSKKENSNHHHTFFSITQTTGISPAQAATYRNNYKTSNPDKISAINFSVQQWEAVNQLIATRENKLEGVSGFRLYFGNTGRDGSGELVSIPYVLNQNLEEEPPMSQMPMAGNFDNNYNSQCPPFCD
jgi:hypothetical protein